MLDELSVRPNSRIGAIVLLPFGKYVVGWRSFAIKVNLDGIIDLLKD